MQRLKQIQRSFATAPSTVQLAYEHFKADQATRGPLVMVHGL
jgi:pimeloyl-ACP methyl ester carboxylesterase